ncbi:MAG: hypothetical protein Kow0054_29830 [Deferrisoma sp.]
MQGSRGRIRRDRRVVRGGSWNNKPRNVRAANRNRNTPDNRNNNQGFRLVAAGRHVAGPRCPAFTDAGLGEMFHGVRSRVRPPSAGPNDLGGRGGRLRAPDFWPGGAP